MILFFTILYILFIVLLFRCGLNFFFCWLISMALAPLYIYAVVAIFLLNNHKAVGNFLKKASFENTQPIKKSKSFKYN